MIKIDGKKIKKLREKQGLTQLYVATFVEVTTDTISRWENNRYPAIKEENGLKLAESLGVQLHDILLSEENAVESNPGVLQEKRPRLLWLKRFSFFTVCIIITSLLLIWIFHYRQPITIVKAKRILPSSVIAGLPFPVVIEVHSSDQDAISLILKETLPPGAEVIQISPQNGSSSKKEEVKWIQKINEMSRFAYLVKISGQDDTEAFFSGSISVSESIGNDSPIPVTGSTLVRLADSHWADSDGDNRISDQEILVVFDRYSNIEELDIDIDQIERMWLGSNYGWDDENKHIIISP